MALVLSHPIGPRPNNRESKQGIMRVSRWADGLDNDSLDDCRKQVFAQRHARRREEFNSTQMEGSLFHVFPA